LHIQYSKLSKRNTLYIVYNVLSLKRSSTSLVLVLEKRSVRCSALIRRFWNMSMIGWFLVFNTTFNNISVISWWSVLLVEETGQTLSHNVVHLALIRIQTHNISGDRH
jgi:hypothetical protein